MRNLVLLVVLALVAPVMASAVELGGADLYGVRDENLSRLLDNSALLDSEEAAQAAGGQFQFHAALVTFWSFDDNLNDLVGQPVYGPDVGFIGWVGPQMGIGISGQYLAGGGDGEIENIDIDDVVFTLTSVYLDFRSRIVDTEGFRMYGATGLGWSQIHLEGEIDLAFMGLPPIDIDETEDGFGYYAALGFEGPWVFGELRYSESTFDAGDDDVGATIENGFQLLVGVRSP